MIKESVCVCISKNELEERMLLNLSKKRWTDGLTITDFEKHASTNERLVKELKNLSEKYKVNLIVPFDNC